MHIHLESDRGGVLQWVDFGNETNRRGPMHCRRPGAVRATSWDCNWLFKNFVRDLCFV